MKKIVLLIMASALIITGCAGTGMQADEELTASRQILNEVCKNKLNKECPEEFKAAKKTFTDAVALYKKCKCKAALEKAKEAQEQLKNLCPVAEVEEVVEVTETVAVVPVDSDNDGVMDANDRCPGTPAGADVNEVGCWVIKGLLFDFNKVEIKPEYYPFLGNVIKVLNENPEMMVEIQGHTDSVGSEALNMKISTKRAKSVAKYLASHGISSKRMTVTGFGKTRPVAPNDTEEGRAMNRRVQIKARN